MLSCREVTRLVSDSHERHLGLQERMSLRMHLAMCTACSKFEDQMATIRTAMRNLSKSNIDADTSGEPDPGAKL
jgi:hypothetical protein